MTNQLKIVVPLVAENFVEQQPAIDKAIELAKENDAILALETVLPTGESVPTKDKQSKIELLAEKIAKDHIIMTKAQFTFADDPHATFVEAITYQTKAYAAEKVVLCEVSSNDNYNALNDISVWKSMNKAPEIIQA